MPFGIITGTIKVNVILDILTNMLFYIQIFLQFLIVGIALLGRFDFALLLYLILPAFYVFRILVDKRFILLRILVIFVSYILPVYLLYLGLRNKASALRWYDWMFTGIIFLGIYFYPIYEKYRLLKNRNE